jgi:shikimate kinase
MTPNVVNKPLVMNALIDFLGLTAPSIAAEARAGEAFARNSTGETPHPSCIGMHMLTEPSPPEHAPEAAIVRLTKPVVLVGLMGVGKSTIGRRLSAYLHMPFVDADEEIEKAAGCTISEIFARFGEPAFRDGERRVIRRLMDGRPQVIATGGGAFADAETRELILSHGIAVWLQADIDVLVERTARRNTRPLLQNGDPREVLTQLASVRNPFYAQAPIHVTSGRGPHETTVTEILRRLAEAA